MVCLLPPSEWVSRREWGDNATCDPIGNALSPELGTARWQQARPGSQDDRLELSVRAELHHHVLHVPAGGIHAEDEPFGDCARVQALAHQPENLLLSRRELRRIRMSPRPRLGVKTGVRSR